MMQRMKNRQEWTSEEIKLLQSLYPQYTSKKWKRISLEFRAKGFSRSEIDCREKWINFVDPQINKKEWEQWELRKMYEIHAEMGTRWCFIQKQIGRTQNQIKNRFYGTLRSFIRFLLNYFENGPSCLNYEITKLSPKFLNDMYNSQNSFLYLKGEVKHALFQMGFRVDRKIMAQIVKQSRALYARLHNFIVSTFQALNQSLPEAQHINAQADQDDKEDVEGEVKEQDIISQRPKAEHVVKKEEFVTEEVDLPWANQSLQNQQLIFGQQNFLMRPYLQPNPAVFYYVLSYM